MTYWRMQLHPSESVGAIKCTVECLSAGYIGLDFAVDVPDLMTVAQSNLPKNQRNYWAFAHEMKVGDRVLLFAHHFPLAVAKVSGDYNYVRAAVPELGVWFRHFRTVEDVRYFGDFATDARAWPHIIMTATITRLRKTDTKSRQLIDRWLNGAA